jgi:hypothetical protein
MADFDMCLDSAAMKNILIGKIQGDFTFVVGGQRYECPAILAEFLSPRLCLSHSVDPSIVEYIVETPDLNDQFKLFMSLGSGSPIGVTQWTFLFFCWMQFQFRFFSTFFPIICL